MIKAEHSVVIRRPVEQVFTFLADFKNEPQFVPAVVKTEQTSAGPIGVGTTYREVNRLILGLRTAAAYQITEYEPNHKVAFKSLSGPAQFKGGYTVEAIGGGTQVTLAGEAVMVGLFKLLEPIIARTVAKQVVASLTNLKAVLEASNGGAAQH
jgi:uncharacterized membrane protein